MKNSDNQPDHAVEMRRLAEETARGNTVLTPENVETLSPDEIRRMLHELRVHQIELEMQNEELRRAQEELGVAWARYFDLYNRAPVGYITICEKGMILEANLTAATLLGVHRGELVTHPISRYILKEDQDIYYLHRKQLFATGEPQVCELRIVKKDGTVFWASLDAAVENDATGASPVSRVVLGDITGRKQAEDAHRESEDRYRCLADATNEGLIIHADGVVLDANRSMAEMLKRDFGEIIGMPILDIAMPEMREKMWRHILDCDENMYESRVIRSDGTAIEVEIIGQSIPWHGREARVAAIRDVTVRKKLEANITRLRQENEMFIRHELKNLLIPLMGYTDLLLRSNKETLSERQISFLQRIKEGSDHAARFINSIKRLQDIEAGIYLMERRPYCLEKIISIAVSEPQPLAEAYGVSIVFTSLCAGETIYLDRDLLPGAFSNLIINAVQHVAELDDPAEKVVTVALSRLGNAYLTRINNRGAAIPPDRLKTFFDKFNTTHGENGGAGLGTTYALLVARAPRRRYHGDLGHGNGDNGHDDAAGKVKSQYRTAE